MIKRVIGLGCMAAALCSAPSRAEAEVHGGDLRLSIDTSLATLGRIGIEDETEFYMGIGPGAQGSSALPVIIPTSVVGLGVGYSLSERTAVGLRAGFQYSQLGGSDSNFSVLNVDLEPELRITLSNEEAKLLFLSLGPLLSFAKESGADIDLGRQLLGGGTIAFGACLFPAEGISVDFSVAAQGRMGKLEYSLDGEYDDDQAVHDLRGIVRIGLSHWR